MNDLSALTDSILAKAKKEAEEIIEAAKAEATRIAGEAKQKAVAAKHKISEDFQRKADDLERRSKIEVELEGRKNNLAAKHRLIERVFEQTFTALLNLPAEKRLRFLAERLADAGMQNGGEVSGAGSPADWNSILKVANEIIARSGSLSQLVLSGEQPDCKGGFILKGPGFVINGSYEAILEELRETLIPQIAAILFDEEKG